jgi:Family of unknown function (DUF6492)
LTVGTSRKNGTVTNRLDAVLPLTASDAGRAQLLFRTLDEFFPPLGTCHVVVPDADVAAVRPRVPHPGYELVAESDVIPEIGWFRTTARVRGRLHLVGPPVHGWFVQQLVKLAIADRVATPFYVTLDADVLCLRPTAYDDLVRAGRAVVQTAPPNHPEWNDDAERVLRLPRSPRQFGVTPAILSRDVVGALARHLERRVDRRLRRLAPQLPSRVPRDIAASWRSFLFRHLPWTEYAVYFTFAEQTGLFERYHVHGGEDAIYGNSVWIESQFDDWQPTDDHPFSVVQSATRVSPDRVAEKVEPYLAARAATKRDTATSSDSSSWPRSLPRTL